MSHSVTIWRNVNFASFLETRIPLIISCVAVNRSLGPTAAGRPPSSAPGRAQEDDGEVADEMGDKDEELRWKDLSSAVKTPRL